MPGCALRTELFLACGRLGVARFTADLEAAEPRFFAGDLDAAEPRFLVFDAAALPRDEAAAFRAVVDDFFPALALRVRDVADFARAAVFFLAGEAADFFVLDLDFAERAEERFFAAIIPPI